MSASWLESRGVTNNNAPIDITQQPPVSAGLVACEGINSLRLSLAMLAPRGNEDINNALNIVKTLHEKVIAEINKNNYSRTLNNDTNKLHQVEEPTTPGFSH